MSKEVIELASNVVESYTRRMLEDAICRVESLDGGVRSEDDLVEIVKDANGAIRWASGTNKELYNEFRYRIFKFNGKYNIVQGKELNVA